MHREPDGRWTLDIEDRTSSKIFVAESESEILSHTHEPATSTNLSPFSYHNAPSSGGVNFNAERWDFVCMSMDISILHPSDACPHHPADSRAPCILHSWITIPTRRNSVRSRHRVSSLSPSTPTSALASVLLRWCRRGIQMNMKSVCAGREQSFK
jgi:hypothetical protein